MREQQIGKGFWNFQVYHRNAKVSKKNLYFVYTSVYRDETECNRKWEKKKS